MCRFGVPKAIINDQGSHLCNHVLATLFQKYGVNHIIFTPYHSQMNGQTKVFNREVKNLFQKLVQLNKKNWSNLMEEALWVL